MPISFSEVPHPEETEAFFFEGMLATGYGSGQQPLPHPTLEGWKQTQYTKPTEHGTLILIDEWGPGSDGPCGLTQIYFLPTGAPTEERILLWVMYYAGTYAKGVIPALQSVLQSTYKMKMFCGGRGLPCNPIPDYPHLQYANLHSGSFMSFRARESVLEGHAQQGRHTCNGGWVR